MHREWCKKNVNSLTYPTHRRGAISTIQWILCYCEEHLLHQPLSPTATLSEIATDLFYLRFLHTNLTQRTLGERKVLRLEQFHLRRLMTSSWKSTSGFPALSRTEIHSLPLGVGDVAQNGPESVTHFALPRGSIGIHWFCRIQHTHAYAASRMSLPCERPPRR